MSGKGERTTVSVPMSWKDRDKLDEEAKRTGGTLSGTIMRLVHLGFDHQAQVDEGVAIAPDATKQSAPVPLLTKANPDVPPSTSIVPVPVAKGAIAPIPVGRPVEEPVAHDKPLNLRPEREPRWDAMEAGQPPIGSGNARWIGVGVLSTLLTLMLIPGNSMAAAGFSQAMLGKPGDGIAASNQLFELYSHRAGPRRYWDATARVADNAARTKVCADRADRLADYRQLETCNIHVSSRRRAIEIGQGIVD